MSSEDGCESLIFFDWKKKKNYEKKLSVDQRNGRVAVEKWSSRGT